MLDRGRNEEAILLLKDLFQSKKSIPDNINLIKAATIIGEYYCGLCNKSEARIWLMEVQNIAAADADMEDVVGYEINLSKELLQTLDA